MCVCVCVCVCVLVSVVFWGVLGCFCGGRLFFVVFVPKVDFSFLLDWFPGWSMYGYTNSEPSDDGYSHEDCVEMRRRFHYPYKGTGKSDTFYWNDRNCMAKNPYICQCYKNGMT